MHLKSWQYSRAVRSITLLVVAIKLALPYALLVGLLGSTPLPLTYLLIIFGIVVLNFIFAEFAKRWFYTAVWKA